MSEEFKIMDRGPQCVVCLGYHHESWQWMTSAQAKEEILPSKVGNKESHALPKLATNVVGKGGEGVPLGAVTDSAHKGNLSPSHSKMCEEITREDKAHEETKIFHKCDCWCHT